MATTHEITSDLAEFKNWDEWMESNPDVSPEELAQYKETNVPGKEAEHSEKFFNRYVEWVKDQKINHTQIFTDEAGKVTTDNVTHENIDEIL